MNLGRVIGSVWATRKVDAFAGATLLMIQPVGEDGQPAGQPLAAVDTIGAGPGDTVMYVTAREAVLAMTGDIDAPAPCDAAVTGIIDFLGKEAR